jgi:hypothetical protein
LSPVLADREFAPPVKSSSMVKMYSQSCQLHVCECKHVFR